MDIDFFEVYKTACKGKKAESIRELTKQILEKAGCTRVGKRNVFERQFDNILVARWVYTLKNSFCSTLDKWSPAKPYTQEVIEDTFNSVIHNIFLDLLPKDDDVMLYIGRTIKRKAMQYARYEMSRLGVFNRSYRRSIRVDGRYKHSYKGAIVGFKRMCIPLDSISFQRDTEDGDSVTLGYESIEDKGFNVENFFTVADELRDAVKYDEIATALLNVMLNSRKRLQLGKIDEYINIDESMKTDEYKAKIATAYNLICREYRRITGDKIKTTKKTAKGIGWKRENRGYQRS